MQEVKEITVSPKDLADVTDVQSWLQNRLKQPNLRVLKKSLDARKYPAIFKIRYEIPTENQAPTLLDIKYPTLKKNAKEVIIIGFGPAGMFAALQLIELGIKPIIIEQGKPVKERRRDLADITKKHIVNPTSNYCFGEGGAGTYSDGKLYTRSTKRGSVQRIFSVLVKHGAPNHILYEAHPHIGTNKLPEIVENMRDSMLQSGAEIHFETQFQELIYSNGKATGIKTNKGDFHANAVILATGHSARNVYEYLDSAKIAIENKPYAIGFRIEHKQEFINNRQYKGNTENLPPAAYSLVHNVNDRGVFSFCMCPGGIIAPCATAPGEIVTNGWSPSKRNNEFANAGIVTQVNQEDLEQLGFSGNLGGLNFQKSVEQKAGKLAEGSQKAPAQFALDYMNGKVSSNLPKSSYIPGLIPVDLNHLFPKEINRRLKTALRVFDKKMKGFLTTNPLLVGPESRTSAPIRIPRNENLMHPEIEGLYPCGEGAGYAGGIASAAIDGERCANAAASFLLKNM